MNNLNNLFLWIPTSILVIYITIVFIKSLMKKEAATAQQVAKGTGNYAGMLLLFTILGTMIGPGYSYGAIEEFYKYGFFYTIFFICACIQFLVFGCLFAGKIQKISNDKETAGDILGTAYTACFKERNLMQITAGILTLLFSVAIIAVLGKGGGSVIASVTGLDIKVAIVAVIMFITMYSFWGGMATVVKTDKPQFIGACLFCLIGLGVAVYLFSSGNATVDVSQFIFNRNGMSVSEIINVLVAFLLGEAFLPVYTIRGMIAKDENAAKKAFIRAACIGAVWFVLLTVIGISAHWVEPDANKLVYLNLIQSTLQGTWWGTLLIGLALAGMLSVVMSTVDSILNSAGVSFRKDIMQQLFPNIKSDNNQQLTYSRYAILLVALLGILLAIPENGIVDLLLTAYAIWIPAVVFPFVYCLIRSKVNNKYSGFFGALSGIITWIVFKYIVETPVPPVLIGLIVNVVLVLAMEYLWKKKS